MTTLAKFVVAAAVVASTVAVPASRAFASKGGNVAATHITQHVDFGEVDVSPYAMSGWLGGFHTDPSGATVHVQFLNDFPGNVGDLPFP